MAVKPVLRMGHPVLNRRAAEVTQFDTDELRDLLVDMHDTMKALNGAGLAAPQIGVSLENIGKVIDETMGGVRLIVAKMVERHGGS